VRSRLSARRQIIERRQRVYGNIHENEAYRPPKQALFSSRRFVGRGYWPEFAGAGISIDEGQP
jgi:hypothetical protein